MRLLITFNTPSLSEPRSFTGRAMTRKTSRIRSGSLEDFELSRRGQPYAADKRQDSIDHGCMSNKSAQILSADGLSNTVADLFPLECKPRQCIFCLGDDRKPYLERIYEYTRSNKMMNEVEKHLRKFGPGDKVACPHPHCKTAGLILPSVQDFKNHTARIHKIFCRA